VTSDVRLAAAGVCLVAALGVAGWVLLPAKAGVWLGLIVVPSLIWAFLEFATHRGTDAARAIRTAHRLTIAAACLLVFVDVSADLTVVLGLDPVWRSVGLRLKWFMTAAYWLAWGNYLPKLRSPWGLAREPFDWQSVHRFVGRAFVICGSALFVVWTLLPEAEARRASLIIVLATIVAGVSRKLLSVVRYSWRGGAPAR